MLSTNSTKNSDKFKPYSGKTVKPITKAQRKLMSDFIRPTTVKKIRSLGVTQEIQRNKAESAQKKTDWLKLYSGKIVKSITKTQRKAMSDFIRPTTIKKFVAWV